MCDELQNRFLFAPYIPLYLDVNSGSQGITDFIRTSQNFLVENKKLLCFPSGKLDRSDHLNKVVSF